MSHFCKLKSKSLRDRQAEWAVQEIERLRAENAELRNDAERYRLARDDLRFLLKNERLTMCEVDAHYDKFLKEQA